MKFATLLNFIGSILAFIALSLVLHTTVVPSAYPNQLTRDEILISLPSLPASPAMVDGGELSGVAKDVYTEIAQQGQHAEEVEPLIEPTEASEEVIATPVAVTEAKQEVEIVAVEADSLEPLQHLLNVGDEQHTTPILENAQPVQAEQNQRKASDRVLPVLTDLFFDVAQTTDQTVAQFSLPKAKVNTDIIQIPIEDGSWPLDDLDEEVGILQGGGEFPGDEYSMIFAGHVTTRWPLLGPFGRLKNSSLGDEVVYQDGEHIFTYEITRFIYAHPSRVDLLFQQERDQIVMVTCNGYDLLTDTFSKRLVSYATLVKVTSLDAPDIALSLDPFR